VEGNGMNLDNMKKASREELEGMYIVNTNALRLQKEAREEVTKELRDEQEKNKALIYELRRAHSLIEDIESTAVCIPIADHTELIENVYKSIDMYNKEVNPFLAKVREHVEAKSAKNIWDKQDGTLQEKFDFILSAVKDRTEGWLWVRNSRCKYVELRIDMRDGGHLLFDRDGARIHFEELKFQHGKD
jgi:hypothetical protein